MSKLTFFPVHRKGGRREGAFVVHTYRALPRSQGLCLNSILNGCTYLVKSLLLSPVLQMRKLKF